EKRESKFENHHGGDRGIPCPADHRVAARVARPISGRFARCVEPKFSYLPSAPGPLRAPIENRESKFENHHGGEGGIRTPGTVAGPAVFKTAAIDHSATSPGSARLRFGWAGECRAFFGNRLPSDAGARACLR